MRKIVVVLLSMLVALTIADLTAEQAGKQFIKSLLKHAKNHDKSIFDKDFYYEDKKRPDTPKKDLVVKLLMATWSIMNDETVWTKGATYAFTDDGLLKINMFEEGKSTSYFLCKPNKDVEGGYTLYAFVQL